MFLGPTALAKQAENIQLSHMIHIVENCCTSTLTLQPTASAYHLLIKAQASMNSAVPDKISPSLTGTMELYSAS